MATGGTLIIKQGNDFVLYKVRHDGYALDEHFKDNKQSFIGNIDQVLQGFINYFNATYFHQGYEIETQFTNGFKLNDPSLTVTTWEDFADVEVKLEEEIENIDPDDGYLCTYGGNIWVDLDKQEVCGFLDNNDNYEVFDSSYKLVYTIEQF